MRIFKKFRPTFSISWLLILTAALSIPFAWYARTAPERARARSNAAESRLLREHGASIDEVYYTWATTPPQPPILDANGDVSLASCGPHVDLLRLTLDLDSFGDLVPVLRQLLPRDGRSHVAIYLHSDTPQRTAIVRMAALELPNCVVFDESKHFTNHIKKSG